MDTGLTKGIKINHTSKTSTLVETELKVKFQRSQVMAGNPSGEMFMESQVNRLMEQSMLSNGLTRNK